jgi:putative molybdopterin biosynthesis protein
MKQQQFLDVVDRDEADRRWRSALDLAPRPSERVPLAAALGRVLATPVRARVDVPSFDRSNMDGFAVIARDTFGATEEEPVRLRLNDESLPTGVEPRVEVRPGSATTIATGAVMPRGADAVVPVELTDVDGREILVRGARVPGAALSYAGSDIARGETVLFAGTKLTSRETAVLAAVGEHEVNVVRRPRVGVLSTGDEIVAPHEEAHPGQVFDSNARAIADAVRELGAEPRDLGIVPDDEQRLREAVHAGLESCDALLLSGGTSKGEGDVCHRVVDELDPGILVHGVALKPGKPLCLASSGGKPVAVLPGFPTSAIFTFHELIAPVLRAMAGMAEQERAVRRARLALTTRSEHGRTEFMLVGLIRGTNGELTAFPMGKGSGSVTSFGRADGFVRIDRSTEIVEAGSPVEVTLIGRESEPADLVIIGSHCVGLDAIASRLVAEGFRVKLIAAGSRGGLEAARRGECDVAPIHLLDPTTGTYNSTFLSEDLYLVSGYCRVQGVVTRQDESRSREELLIDPTARMVNRERGSGTRVLIDELLDGREPPGYSYDTRSHNAVAAAVAAGRADWGVAIETVARDAGLAFHALAEEHYDFAVRKDRRERPAVQALMELLREGSDLRRELSELGFRT